MSYATQSDAVAMYGTDYVTVAADKDGDGAIDTALFQAALDRATSIVNGKLADRVPLPLDPIPEDIKGYVVDMAIYYSSVTCDVMTEQKSKLFDQAIKAVDMMAKNMTSLGLEDPPDNSSAEAEFSSDTRVFTRKSLCKVM